MRNQKSMLELPEGYFKICQIDLQKDKKTALLVNAVSLLIVLVLFAAGILLVPLARSEEPELFFIKMGVAFAGIAAYIILHEAVHGAAMKYFGARKIQYGFTGLYAFAGSEEYYAKKPYCVIALAPVAVWGGILFILNFVVPAGWFWTVYAVQICNLSGAAGDLYVICKLFRLPEDILIKDDGVAMTVYSACAQLSGQR